MKGVRTLDLTDSDQILSIRPIRADDGPRLQTLMQSMSDESRYYRFMDAIRELPAPLLKYFVEVDFDFDMALVAVVDLGTERENIVAVARYFGDDDGLGCEFALAVADAWHHHGIGHRLMQELFECARSHGYQHMHGDVLADNAHMLHLMQHLGFRLRTSPEDPGLKLVERRLDALNISPFSPPLHAADAQPRDEVAADQPEFRANPCS